MIYAIDGNHEDIVRELMDHKSGMSDVMTLLKLGIHKRRHDAAAKDKVRELKKAEVRLEDLVQLCSKMQRLVNEFVRGYSI